MGERCETCSSEMELNLEAVTSTAGVYCVTICDECTMFNRFPRLSAAAAAEHVLEHCRHLSITADRMAELLDQNRPD
jgi:hypothetical protein